MQRGIVGIYKIINNDNGKVYIGQSVDVEYRICNHFSCLRHNRHENEHLQRAYNLNPAAFTWELIQECDVNDLDVLEVYYIGKYDSTDRNKGYNRRFDGIQDAAEKLHLKSKSSISNVLRGKAPTGAGFIWKYDK